MAYAADDEGKKKKKSKKRTIADFVEILEAVEREENYEAARFFASQLNYIKLTKMAMAFTKGKVTDSKNDPNQMPMRFMLPTSAAANGKRSALNLTGYKK